MNYEKLHEKMEKVELKGTSFAAGDKFVTYEGRRYVLDQNHTLTRYYGSGENMPQSGRQISANDLKEGDFRLITRSGKDELWRDDKEYLAIRSYGQSGYFVDVYRPSGTRPSRESPEDRWAERMRPSR